MHANRANQRGGPPRKKTGGSVRPEPGRRGVKPDQIVSQPASDQWKEASYLVTAIAAAPPAAAAARGGAADLHRHLLADHAGNALGHFIRHLRAGRVGDLDGAGVVNRLADR